MFRAVPRAYWPALKPIVADVPLVHVRITEANDGLSLWGPLEKLIWRDVLIVASVLFFARLLILAVQWQLRQAAETARPHRRLVILRIVPIARLLIRAAAIVALCRSWWSQPFPISWR